LDFKQEVKKAIRDLEEFPTQLILNQIAFLRRNLENLKAERTRLIVYAEYIKIKRAYTILLEVKRYRDGFQMPEETQQSADRALPGRTQRRGRSEERPRRGLSLVRG
jgi:LytS/YehU family sensor histidine kinase